MDVASHSLVLLQQLNIQREFGFLCDCTVAIGDVYFKAHRAVLAAFSNYFKMIFIHQSSECIKIQPADIQPDIFSYLLHIMYTGKCPKQTVDHGRLEEGIRFLHANHLSRNPNEVGQGFIYDIMPSSNLYGIQISSAQKAKESVVTKEKAAGGLGDKPAMQNDHRQFQLSLAIGLEGTSSEHQFSHLPSSAADLIQTAGEASKSTNTIKQEKCDPELPVVPQSSFLPSVEGSVPNCPKVNIKVHTCHYCGEQFNSRSSLLEHVYTHASGSLPFGVPSSILESNDLGEVQPLSEDISPQEGHPALGFRVNDSSQPVEKSLTNNMENLLQVNQQADPVSLMQTEAEPLELNCNYSFSRKRKFACAVCGQKFLQKQQLLEHMYSHTGKTYRYNTCHRAFSRMNQGAQLYSDSWSKSTETVRVAQDASHSQSFECDPSLGSIATVVIE